MQQGQVTFKLVTSMSFFSTEMFQAKMENHNWDLYLHAELFLFFPIMCLKLFVCFESWKLRIASNPSPINPNF